MLTPRRRVAQLKSDVKTAPGLCQAPKESVHGKIVRKTAELNKSKPERPASQKKTLAAANREPMPRADASWRVDDPQASVQERPGSHSNSPRGQLSPPLLRQNRTAKTAKTPRP